MKMVLYNAILKVLNNKNKNNENKHKKKLLQRNINQNKHNK